ncbi:hypothetical protein [Microbulbifer mangrovi]|uniref:hypothetical protein n=1 Tax=Microbulbifer mangrovi TaxID=927787 RepID=UPI00099065EE|nr:hypothetical protein [Microbulbifer mangrovi]
MIVSALIIAATCTIIFYAGLAVARRTQRKLYRVLIRIGAVLLMIVAAGVVPSILEVSLATTELAGSYLFFMLMGGALIYKLLLVRFIPLPSEQPQS